MLESLVSVRLVHLHKNADLRPIGVWENLYRIAGKIAMSITKDDVTKAGGNSQLCGGQDVIILWCEAAIHSMHDIFAINKTETLIILDAEKAFSSINRKAFLNSKKHICPPIATSCSKTICTRSWGTTIQWRHLAVRFDCNCSLRNSISTTPETAGYWNYVVGGKTFWMMTQGTNAFENQVKEY